MKTGSKPTNSKTVASVVQTKQRTFLIRCIIISGASAEIQIRNWLALVLLAMRLFNLFQEASSAAYGCHTSQISRTIRDFMLKDECPR